MEHIFPVGRLPHDCDDTFVITLTCPRNEHQGCILVDIVNLREEFVFEAIGGGTDFSSLCMDYGISRKTGYKWLERFRQQGIGGLREQSRRPHSSPDALSEDVICSLIRIKQSAPKTWSPKKVPRPTFWQ